MLYTTIPSRVFSVVVGLLACLCPMDVAAEITYAGNGRSQEKGIVLVVASYNPDTKRMSEFITEFENYIVKKEYGYRVLIEDMGCKGIDEAEEWERKLSTLLERYDEEQLRAIILLGQEAWASFLLQDFPPNIPFFACFASKNGIVLPVDSQIDKATWQPESIDMERWAHNKGQGGGILNEYNVKKNIDLIKSLYPNITNVAFLSDNTYGGLSLQALVRKEIANYPELNLITIDSREVAADDLQQKVSSLPPNTALLLGTWRVDADGMYFLNSSLNSLMPLTANIPIFTLTGTGFGTIAIGGYVPSYEVDARQIADQIYDYYRGDLDSVFFNSLGGRYMFDKQMIARLGIKEYQLPNDSLIINRTEDQLRKMRGYIIAAIVVVLILALFVLILYRMNYHNKTLKDSLIENEKQLIISKDRAEESGRLKSAFLANMSHEIRTPLNAIVGFSTLLCDESQPQESKEEFSKIIMANSNILLTLINDVLDISRLDTDKIIFDYRDEDVDAICRQVMSTTEYAKKAGVEYIYKPNPESYILNIDAQRLSQVLINLMTNANKFTEHGSITLGYDVDEPNGSISFFVSDTGCGIPEDMHSKVFDRFEKLDEYKQGTGLGLAICEQITTRFGGRIWIDADYTQGSRFVFSLPIKRANQ